MTDKSKTITSDKINKDGQVTLPAEIREVLNLKEGDQLHFNIQDNGDIIVTKKILMKEVFGSLKIRDDLKDILFEEARKRAKEAMAKEYIMELEEE
ncbi:MAG TPA: AbrB/MazE/SpoVT family DNA-binding domain-containing protein [Bacillus sp. (in: firmicutes)]|nr:AbrB/MazE/SpoVT family DNA-binding domain-containing protein [Bacillus sp. (in: firmicutes)]